MLLSFPPTPSFSELGGLLKYVRPFLNSISKAKAARLVRSLLDMFLDMEAATGQEVELCLECIEWAKAEKRTFLRQALEVRRGAVAGLVSPPVVFFRFVWTVARECGSLNFSKVVAACPATQTVRPPQDKGGFMSLRGGLYAELSP